MKFPVLEMFVSIQGEGKYTGCPSLFVRLAGCNLRCVFGNSRCDTPYSSFELDKPIYETVEDAVVAARNYLAENPTVNHIVITGGEPLLYKNQLNEFIDGVLFDNPTEVYKVITVETNGTLSADGIEYVDLWSVSPKLSTSVDKCCKFLTEEQRDRHDKTRINIDNLTTYIADNSDFQLKFVYTSEESVTEIKGLLSRLTDALNDKNIWWMDDAWDINEHVMLMPEGTNNEQLSNISQECADVCIREGWRFCDRLHIRIWGDKRCV